MKQDGTFNIFIFIARVLLFPIAFLNLFAPVFSAPSMIKTFIHFLVLVFWFKGLAGLLGYCKKVVAREENGRIRYEITVPVLQVFVLRIIEFFYGALRSSFSINIVWFLSCLALDVVYLLVLLFAKSNYYYESVEE